MPKYTNTTKGSLDFATGGTPTNPTFTSFKPGETKDADLNVEDPSVKGALAAEALIPADAAATKRAAKAAAISAS